MSDKFIFLPTFVKKSDVTFHKKEDYKNVDYNFTERTQYSYEFKETHNSNLHQVFIKSEYTFTTEETDYFCRFDIISPFEINRYVIDLNKEHFQELAEVHIQNTKEEFNLNIITFPDGYNLQTENDNVNSEYIAIMLIDFRNIQSSIKN